jgi:hypothetical protein
MEVEANRRKRFLKKMFYEIFAKILKDIQMPIHMPNTSHLDGLLNKPVFSRNKLDEIKQYHVHLEIKKGYTIIINLRRGRIKVIGYHNNNKYCKCDDRRSYTCYEFMYDYVVYTILNDIFIFMYSTTDLKQIKEIRKRIIYKEIIMELRNTSNSRKYLNPIQILKITEDKAPSFLEDRLNKLH